MVGSGAPVPKERWAVDSVAISPVG